MKIFLGVILTLIVVALVFRLTRKEETPVKDLPVITEQAGSRQNSTIAPATMGRPKVELKNDVVIQQSQGGISIAELYKNRNNYANKKVRVKGKVVKVNPEVMDRNWVHLQDGTSDSGNFDLTVTTIEEVIVDGIVEFEGTIVLNKDFGAGYTYDVIMEGGVIRR